MKAKHVNDFFIILFMWERYLHSKGIVHRDLKLENFILTDKTPTAQIKLIDFGFSRSYLESGGPMNEVVGTPFYFAPEVLERSYTVQADLWSFGVVIFMMLTGTPPFCGKTTKNIVDGIHRASKNQAKTTKRIAAMLSRVPVSTQVRAESSQFWMLSSYISFFAVIQLSICVGALLRIYETLQKDPDLILAFRPRGSTLSPGCSLSTRVRV